MTDTSSDIKSSQPASKKLDKMQEAPQEASLGKRYGIKLISNIASIPLFFLLEAILPRIMGPALYGQYNFAYEFFAQLSNLFDPGISACSRTYFAKRPGEISRLYFSTKIFFIIAGLFLICSACLLLPQFNAVFLPDVPPWLIMPVALLALAMWATAVSRGLNDALGVSHISELVRIANNLIVALLILILFLLSLLSLPIFLTIQVLSYAILALGFVLVLRKEWLKRFKKPQDIKVRNRLKYPEYKNEFTKFCKPLLFLSIASTLSVIAERWILQYFGGSVAQGYFSLSQKIGMGCYLFVSAMIPLMMREMAVAHEKKDMKTLGSIVDRLAPLLYAIVAWFCCFTAMEARGVIRIFGGESFADALFPVQVMVFFPLHHAYLQICMSLYYSTDNTRAYRTIMVSGLLVGLLVTWLLVAPKEFLGLNLSSLGLAVKMVGVQILVVTILLISSRRFVPFSLKKNLLHQVICPVFFLGLAFLAQKSTLIFDNNLYSVPRFFVSGIIYTLYSAIGVILFPHLLGMSREEFKRQAFRVINYLIPSKYRL